MAGISGSEPLRLPLLRADRRVGEDLRGSEAGAARERVRSADRDDVAPALHLRRGIRGRRGRCRYADRRQKTETRNERSESHTTDLLQCAGGKRVARKRRDTKRERSAVYAISRWGGFVRRRNHRRRVEAI